MVYVIQLDETHPSSLASLFGVTEDRLLEILELCGLAKTHGSTVRIQGEAFGTFLKSSLDIDGAEFEKCKLQGYNTKKWYLKIGRRSENKKTISTAVNAKIQFSNPLWKAPSPKRKHQRQLQDELEDLAVDIAPVDVVQTDVHLTNGSLLSSPCRSSRQENSPSPPQKSTPQRSTPEQTKITEQQYIQGYRRIVVLKFLSKFVSSELLAHPEFWLEESEAIGADGILESFFDASCALQSEKDKRDLGSLVEHEEAVKAAVNPRLIEEEINEEKYPVLKLYGIPVRDDQVIQNVLRDITKLSKEVKSINLLTFSTYNDTPTTLVRVPKSKRYDRFVRNARQTKWITQILDAVVPPAPAEKDAADGDDCDDTTVEVDCHDEVGQNRDDAARWLLTYLGKKYPWGT